MIRLEPKHGLFAQFRNGPVAYQAIAFNFRGREYNDKYFTNVVGWKILDQKAEVADTKWEIKSEPEAMTTFPNPDSNNAFIDDEPPF